MSAGSPQFARGDWVIWVRETERGRCVVAAVQDDEQIRVVYKAGFTRRVHRAELILANGPPGESADEWLTRNEAALDGVEQSE